ncbi:hypothetical protein ACFODZ_08630 [Marinicella sediminis]|uniref:TnsA endonuclease N-terminal domain-containing protein n=1 Tax=Marinicella sediminis TaxID=1792834 RepID=A0ABV7JB11_9GAMM|nr:hypothetical protein [Marinicella sediminis]
MEKQFFQMAKQERQFAQNFFSDVRIESESLTPIQQHSSAKKLNRATDYYLQRFIKFPQIAIFHSYPEYLHAALLEGNPLITSFVPQPFRLLVQNRRYVPDCFYVFRTKRYVIELKPEGKFDTKLKKPLKGYFKQQGFNFKVLTNESILKKETLALNWHHIVKTLLSAEMINTDTEELKIMDQLSVEGETEFGLLIKIGDRLANQKLEIAVFRLAHRGQIALDLKDRKINYSTMVALCS